MAGKQTLPDLTIIPPEKVEVVAASYDVTPAGMSLLHVFADPVNRTLTKTARADMAGISRETYYALFRDERFRKAFNELFVTSAFEAAVPIMQTLVDSAVKGDTNAAKMALEISGHYQKTEKVEHTHTLEAGKSFSNLYDKWRGKRPELGSGE